MLKSPRLLSYSLVMRMTPDRSCMSRSSLYRNMSPANTNGWRSLRTYVQLCCALHAVIERLLEPSAAFFMKVIVSASGAHCVPPHPAIATSLSSFTAMRSSLEHTAVAASLTTQSVCPTLVHSV